MDGIKNYESRIMALIALFIIQYSLFIPQIHAQTIKSNPVTILFGNAQPPAIPAAGVNPTGSNSDLLSATQDLFSAYQSCTGQNILPPAYDSLTFLQNKWTSSKKTCLMNFLHAKYSTTLPGFDDRYRPGVLPDGCVQCLGYVALSISLTSGSGNALDSGNAGSHYNDTQILSGNLKLLRFTLSNNNPIQGGDVGIAPACPGDPTCKKTTEGIGGAGHALIVKGVNPKFPAQFGAVESSFPSTCYLNQSYETHFTEVYHFFRKDKI